MRDSLQIHDPQENIMGQFDFPFFTRKHDSFGSPSMMINKNNNDVKQFLDEEGMEGNNSKRKMVLYPLQQD